MDKNSRLEECSDAENDSMNNEGHDDYFSAILQPLIDEKFDEPDVEYDPDRESGPLFQSKHPSFAKAEHAGVVLFQDLLNQL